jgi:hypothetical protein
MTTYSTEALTENEQSILRDAWADLWFNSTLTNTAGQLVKTPVTAADYARVKAMPLNELRASLAQYLNNKLSQANLILNNSNIAKAQATTKIDAVTAQVAQIQTIAE